MSPYTEFSHASDSTETYHLVANYKLYLILILPVVVGSTLLLLCRCINYYCTRQDRTFSYTLRIQPNVAVRHNIQSCGNALLSEQQNVTDDPPSYIQVALNDLSIGKSKFLPVKSALRKTPTSVHNKDKRLILNKTFSI